MRSAKASAAFAAADKILARRQASDTARKLKATPRMVFPVTILKHPTVKGRVADLMTSQRFADLGLKYTDIIARDEGPSICVHDHCFERLGIETGLGDGTAIYRYTGILNRRQKI